MALSTSGASGASTRGAGGAGAAGNRATTKAKGSRVSGAGGVGAERGALLPAPSARSASRLDGADSSSAVIRKRAWTSSTGGGAPGRPAGGSGAGAGSRRHVFEDAALALDPRGQLADLAVRCHELDRMPRLLPLRGDLALERAHRHHLDALVPRQLGEPGEKRARFGGARRPSHLAEHGRPRAQLGGHLLLAEADLVGETPALVGGAHPLARQRPPLGELIGQDHEKDEGHRDPRGEERAASSRRALGQHDADREELVAAGRRDGRPA